MKDEIIEILNRLKYSVIKHSFLDMSLSEYNTLLDYITNLQQENEDLKDYLDIFKLSNKTKQETIDDFRKRVDKAVEYIESLCYIESKNEWFTYGDDLSPEHIVNILNGGDE